MSRLILCLEKSELKDLIKVHFAPFSFIELIFTEDPQEVVNYINMFPDVRAVISETIVKQTEAAIFIDQMLTCQSLPISLFAIGDLDDVGMKTKYQFRLEDHQKMILSLKSVLGIEDNNSNNSSLNDSVSMPAHLFLHFENLPFDIYLKVQQSHDNKLIKLFNAKEPIDHLAIKKYMNRGVVDFYLKREWLKEFSKLLIKQLENRLIESLPSNESQLEAEGEVFNSLKDMVTSLGLKPQVQKLCEISMLNVQRRFSEESPFKSFLENLKSNQKLNFHFAFVQLSSLLCSQYVEHTDWPRKQKDDLMEKLVFSAFFCDMNLPSDEMLMARSEEDLLNFNSKEMDILNSHAQKIAESLKTYPNIPQDVDKIIMQHHGVMNGHGYTVFPWGGTVLAAQILFYSQDLALRILTANGKKLGNVLTDFESSYVESPQIEIVSKFLKSFKETSSLSSSNN